MADFLQKPVITSTGVEAPVTVRYILTDEQCSFSHVATRRARAIRWRWPLGILNRHVAVAVKGELQVSHQMEKICIIIGPFEKPASRREVGILARASAAVADSAVQWAFVSVATQSLSRVALFGRSTLAVPLTLLRKGIRSRPLKESAQEISDNG